jgi:hypothetical protein
MATTAKLLTRFSSVLGLLLAIAPAVLAQNVTIAPGLRAGDEFRLEIVRIRENSQRPQQNGRSTTAVDVRVASVAATGIALDWTAGQTSFDNQQMADDPLVAAASNAVRGLKMRILLNARGEYAGLGNQTEVAAALRKGTDVIVRGLLAKIPLEQRKPFERMIAQALSPATMIASATRETQIYFSLHGIALAVGETVERRIDQPNPLGSGAIPAIWRVRLDSASAESAVARTTMTYDSAALKEMTRALAEQSGKPIPPEVMAQIPPIEMADDGNYVFDRTVGLMREVGVNRRMTTGANRRLDGWEIRLVAPPKR